MKLANKLFFIPLGLLFLSVIFLFITPVLRINHLVYIGYNEGFNAYHTLQVINGEPLYVFGFTPVNYPPLYFFIIAFLSSLFSSDPLFIGRYLSLIALIGVAFCVGIIARYFKSGIKEAVFSSLFFLGLIASLGSEYVGMNDPQLIALFFVLLGIVLYLKSKNLFLTAVFFIIGIFTKHNLLALPLALNVYLILSNKKEGIKLLLYLVALGLGLTFLIQYFSQGQFLHLMLLKREYTLSHLLSLSLPILAKVFLPLAASVFFLRKFSNSILLWYFVFSLVLGLYFAGGSGTDVNMYFDLFIACSIIIGVWLSSLKNKKIYFVMSLILSGNILVAIPLKIKSHEFNLRITDEEIQTKNDVLFISKHKTPLCEGLVLCYLAKKPFLYDPYNTDELVITKQIPETEILKPVEGKQYDLIELQHPIDKTYFTDLGYTLLQRQHRFTENFYRVMGKNYHFVRISIDGTFYESNSTK